jgi:uncharacterized protein YrrD
MLTAVSSGDPISYLTLQTGTEMISADGDRVGVVEHVLHDEATDVFDGIVIDTSLGPGGKHFVDAPEVAELRTDAVVLTLSTTEVAQLPKPEPNPAVMEHHGEEDSENQLQHKLRRAWDLISGRG